MANLVSSGTKQKIKSAAKYAGYTAGGAVILVSTVTVGLFIVNKLFEPNFLSSLEKDNVFIVAAAIGFVVIAATLIGISIYDYRKKIDNELGQENKGFQQNNAVLENDIKDLEKYTSAIENTLGSNPDAKLSDLFKIEDVENDKGEKVKRVIAINV